MCFLKVLNRVKVWQLMNICFKKLRDLTDPPGSRHKMNTIQCSVEIRLEC